MGKGSKGSTDAKAAGYMDADGGGGSEQPSAALRAANALSFVAALAANGAVGSKVGDVSHKYPNKIVPDGWAFSIWGIIYTLLIGFVVYQARCPTKRSSHIIDRIGWLFVASNVCNAAWIVTWCQGTPASCVASCPLLFALLACNVAIAWRSGAWQPSEAVDRTWLDVLLVDVSFSIYSGWCTVAAIVNVAASGVAYGWTDNFIFSESQWAAVMLAVAGVVNLAYLITRSDPVYPLVYVWACLAIHTNADKRDDHVVNTAALAGVVVMLCADAGAAVLFRRQRQQNAASGHPGEGSNLLPS